MRKGVDYIGITICYFCHDGKGNFVMAKRGKNCRDENGRWDIGAGALEFGENVEDRLRKEIKEEYCAEVKGFKFIGFEDVHRIHNGEKTHWLAINYKVLLDPKEVEIGEPHKFDDLDWFRLDKLPAPEKLHSKLPEFLRKYRKQLN